MDTLFLTLFSLSVIVTIYGIIQIWLLSREYLYRGRVFEHHLDGRNIERRDSNRRSMPDVRHA